MSIITNENDDKHTTQELFTSPDNNSWLTSQQLAVTWMAIQLSDWVESPQRNK